MKAFFFLKGESEDQDKPEKFGFASSKSPPSLPELKNFEDDLLNLVADKLAYWISSASFPELSFLTSCTGFVRLSGK